MPRAIPSGWNPLGSWILEGTGLFWEKLSGEAQNNSTKLATEKTDLKIICISTLTIYTFNSSGTLNQSSKSFIPDKTHFL
jgi:hypothetical protein